MLSLLYGSGVTLRNKMFDRGMLKSIEFDVPVIAIGNLRVGGTGKTPCTEWLLELFQSEYKVAMLSRGYGRRTKGFRWVNAADTAKESGDEPVQVKQKFPDVPIAVCEDRATGIVQMLADVDADVILLDDAFQHRYVKPSYSIVLSSFHQPFFSDELLPMGRLREQPKHLKRADCLIYTKCPDDWQEQRGDYIAHVREYAPNALVAFSKLAYATPKPVFETTVPIANDVLLITAIADAKPLVQHLEKQFNVVRHYAYPDHYQFMKSDVTNWRNELKKHATSTVVFTTEKDAVRLKDMKEQLKDLPIYFVPMKMEMVEGQQALTASLKERIAEVSKEK